MIRAVLAALMLLVIAVPAQAEAAPGCSEKTIALGTQPEHSVTTHDDCSVDVELNKGIICVGAWTATDEYDVGPVHVTNHRCTFPGGDPLPPLVVATSAGPCGQAHVDGIVSIAVNSDCSVVISFRPYACVWGGYWYEHTPPPVTVREYRCGPSPF